MVHRRLARGVGVGLEGRDLEAVDRADVDDTCWVAGPGAALEQWEAGARQVEDRLQVERQYLVPRRVGVLGERRAPVGACVVDQDVERRLAPGERVGQAARAGLAREIGGEREARALTRQLGRDLVADVRLA